MWILDLIPTYLRMRKGIQLFCLNFLLDHSLPLTPIRQ